MHVHADMHAMHHFSRKHVTATATCTEPPGRKATHKHRHALCSPLFQVPSAAFECICSLRSRKKNIFTDLHCTAPKFLCVYIYIYMQFTACKSTVVNWSWTSLHGQLPLSFNACTFGCPLQLGKQVPRLPVIILMCHVNMQTRIEKGRIIDKDWSWTFMGKPYSKTPTHPLYVNWTHSTCQWQILETLS